MCILFCTVSYYFVLEWVNILSQKPSMSMESSGFCYRKTVLGNNSLDSVNQIHVIGLHFVK